ncbi:MAG: Y-family DNA polymerase [Planctomycetaceae bacterium]|nr:Y-family DNA polymerase [Planctomycetaceae bacterium]
MPNDIIPLHLYSLVDCNCFFVSCEKLFRPDLRNRAIVVLSNNDGVVVSRSPEAKKLGIPMGESYFKIKRLVEHGLVTAFSSNYRMYGDLSNRVMRTLTRWTPNVEIYSIDESFMDFTGLGVKHSEIDSLLHEITSTVKRWTGIPVSIGLGPTVTLSKVANDLAKKGDGTCSLVDVDKRRAALEQMEIGEVWGIGRRLVPKMRKLGIRSALQLADMDPLWMRREFSIVLERLVRELNGERCLELHTIPQPRQSIQVSRSFREATDDYRVLEEGVSTFATKACEKARQDGTVASAIYVHLNTSYFKEGYVSGGLVRGLDVPTAYTPRVIRVALELLGQIYRPGLMYKKASVTLLDTKNAKAVQSQGLLFDSDGQTPEQRQQDAGLMESVDRINHLLGPGKVFFGAQGTTQNWRGASDHCSPGYTTNWRELPVVKAK